MKFYIVDCFAEDKYQGNELLVVKPDRPVSDEEQQAIAREINFSETSFILSDKKADGGYDVRIWTPNMEVPFAGHPTLGTAHVIREILEHDANETVALDLKAGRIPVRRTGQGQTMSQNPPKFGDSVTREEIADIYGIDADDIRDDFPIQWVSTGLEAVLIPLKSREALAKLITDKDKFTAYSRRHPENYCNHLFFVDMGEGVLHARCLMEDFVEDPATGSANGDLAAYLIEHRWFGTDDISYTVIQGEDMGRKSVLHVHAAHKADDWTIEVGGNCFIVASGDWE